jgi:hypothetical protein
MQVSSGFLFDAIWRRAIECAADAVAAQALNRRTALPGTHSGKAAGVSPDGIFVTGEAHRL